MTDTQYGDLTLDTALAMTPGDPEMWLQRSLAARLSSIATEMATFKAWCDRFDALYFATTFTDWGADLWADDPSATTEGRSHISINTPTVYVDVPAALQAVAPIENMLAREDSPEARHAAQALERIRKAWKPEVKWDLKFHKACTVKGLYGRTASYVYYDRTRNPRIPVADVIENPRNLWMGYRSDEYDEVEWAAHVSLLDPNTVVEKFSAVLDARRALNGSIVPWIVGLGDQITEQPRPELTFGPARVEVWDYWYRLPGTRGKLGEPTTMTTWNVVVAGNAVVRGPTEYPEYDGDIPYRSLFNTFIPGVPSGRSELHDMEQLIREKMTRVTAGAQMIASATAGQYWQLVGQDSPQRVPPQAKPRLNEVAAPGAGNRIEAISPFIAQFQLEQFLGRIDREMATVSGLNDLLLGLAPAQVLSSSKAINALIANYESRISMRRLLLYEWSRDTWDLVLKVWANKDERVRKVLDDGGGTLDIIDPSLSPKDEMETAQRAINLVNNKLWAQARGMDAVGVDDPEQEQNIIREERTDATLFPADVQVMAQLLAALQSLGLQAPAGAEQQAQQQMSRGQSDLRNALGGNPGAPGSQGAAEQQITPPEAMVPGATPGGGAAPFAQGPQAPSAQLQGMIQGGQSKGRILTNQNISLGRR